MRRTKSRERECLTTQSWRRSETFMVSSAGSTTSTLRTRRIITRCTPLSESSLTVPRITINSSTTLHWRTRSSSAKTPQKAPWLNYPEAKAVWAPSTLQLASNRSNHSPRWRKPREVALWIQALSSRVVTTPHHSCLEKTRVTDTPSLKRSSEQWAKPRKSHSCEHRSIQWSCLRLTMALSWASTSASQVVQVLRQMPSERRLPRSGDWRAKNRAGTTTSSQYQSTIRRCTRQWESHLSRFEANFYK